MKAGNWILCFILWIMCPVSPFIWMAAVSDRLAARERLFMMHLVSSAVIWLMVALLFGFYGGLIISKMAAIY